MTDNNLPELFPVDHDRAPAAVTPLHGTGILPSQNLAALIDSDAIGSLDPITPDQVQPASLDLRLGNRAYRVRASFLPGRDSTVMDRVRQLDGLPAIDLTTGAVLERGAVYVVEIIESVRLPNDVEGAANPKSSTGRLDVLTRLITDRGTAFDRIEAGYKGPLYLEVAPLTFRVLVRKGSRLNQVRFQKGKPLLGPGRVQREYDSGRLIRVDGERLQLRGSLVPLTVDLGGAGTGGVVGYKAKKSTNKIDVDLANEYDPRDYWDAVDHAGGRLLLEQGDFYILATREEVGVPPQLAAEMLPFDPSSGEFRVHYAGFFDPGFGWSESGAGGSKAVLEVRSHGVPFTLEHGQVVGWLAYSQVASGRPDKLYGQGIRSNYQGQGLALAKHFRPWAS